MDLRPFDPSDVPQTAELFCRIFRAHGRPNRDAVAAELHDVYFGNPWYDPHNSSLVCEEDGRVAGFLGVIPLPMRLGNREVRAAVGGNFMIDPAVRNPFSGALLFKRFLDGTHELPMTDTSNEMGRRMWTSKGGTTLHLYSLQWFRMLRPAGYALALTGRVKPLRPVTWMGRPLAGLADAALARLARNPFRPVESELEARELTPELIIEGIDLLSHVQRLVPEYTPESLGWLLRMAARKREFGGRLIGRALFQRGALVGWYLYHPNTGRRGQVLQVLARPQQARQVLEHLFADAWHEGSTALVGRAHPLLMNDLPVLNCVFSNRRTWVQIHTRDAEILNAVHRGEALLTRLEGEWWTRFQNDSFEEPAPAGCGDGHPELAAASA